jgi:outer membrane lipoprotein SlyB
MTSRAKTFLPLILLGALASCASQTGWQPTIDTANDPHANKLQTDLAQCQQLADKAANQTTTVGEDTAIGAVGGAAGGALLGAIAGGPATGAAIGAVAGTGLGLGGSTISSNATYKNAYIHCMQQRGHPVIN